MLSDDEFLRNVLPQLRAKSAAQGRVGDSLHDSSSRSSSPKNDPNGHDRNLWFRGSLTQLTKFGKSATVQVRAYAEPRHAALSSDADGFIVLSEPTMGGEMEDVSLVSLRSQDITAGDGVKIGHRRVLELVGIEIYPQRRYFVTMKILNGDPNAAKMQRLWADWLARKKARGNAATEWLADESIDEDIMKKIRSESPLVTVDDWEKALTEERKAEINLQALRRKLLGE